MRFPILLNKEEYEKFKLRVQVTGFKSMGAFVRDRVLKDNLITEKKIMEIYNVLVEKNGKK
jgi:hypothetical protein